MSGCAGPRAQAPDAAAHVHHLESPRQVGESGEFLRRFPPPGVHLVRGRQVLDGDGTWWMPASTRCFRMFPAMSSEW